MFARLLLLLSLLSTCSLVVSRPTPPRQPTVGGIVVYGRQWGRHPGHGGSFFDKRASSEAEDSLVVGWSRRNKEPADLFGFGKAGGKRDGWNKRESVGYKLKDKTHGFVNLLGAWGRRGERSTCEGVNLVGVWNSKCTGSSKVVPSKREDIAGNSKDGLEGMERDVGEDEGGVEKREPSGADVGGGQWGRHPGDGGSFFDKRTTSGAGSNFMRGWSRRDKEPVGLIVFGGSAGGEVDGWRKPGCVGRKLKDITYDRGATLLGAWGRRGERNTCEGNNIECMWRRCGDVGGTKVCTLDKRAEIAGSSKEAMENMEMDMGEDRMERRNEIVANIDGGQWGRYLRHVESLFKRTSSDAKDALVARRFPSDLFGFVRGSKKGNDGWRKRETVVVQERNPVVLSVTEEERKYMLSRMKVRPVRLSGSFGGAGGDSFFKRGIRKVFKAVPL